jgi:hypothetical protein
VACYFFCDVVWTNTMHRLKVVLGSPNKIIIRLVVPQCSSNAEHIIEKNAV